MTDADNTIRVLTERRNWLTARIAAKTSVGWDIDYDTRERDALSDALIRLATGTPPTVTGSDRVHHLDRSDTLQR